MSNAFEYGDALLPEGKGSPAQVENAPPQVESNQPYLNLATFRMVVLADEILESFFEVDFSATFKLEPIYLDELPSSNSGFLSGLWSNIASNDNKKMFHKLTDEVGRTIGKHQVLHRPAIGRYTKLEEPKARESLLTPSMRRSASKSSLNESDHSISPQISSLSISVPSSSSTLVIDSRLSSTPQAEFLPLPIVKAANAALTMERTPFAIDDAKDDDDDDDDFDTDEETEDGGDDDLVLDEVDAFLEAHDSGLTDADKEIAKDLLNAEPVK